MPWQSLKSIMNKSLEKAGISEQVTAQRVLDTAQKMLEQRWGEDLARMVEFTTFSHGNLNATSSSSAAIQTLKTERIDFINAINCELGKRAVQRVNVKLVGRAHNR
ncbi:DUF721 domain-containing protein [Candidatus Uhrbacteria bacterium]|nr:DUF721 domain-containing protein [Candidatus Uhrbacteria bacterium]